MKKRKKKWNKIRQKQVVLCCSTCGIKHDVKISKKELNKLKINAL